jgi:hypothetical protein
MNTLYLQATAFTPRVQLNATTGMLEFKGRSTSENALEFYRPILNWIKEYAKNPQPTTTLSLQLDYFNSSSSKCLLDIIRNVSRVQTANHTVVINWLYQADDVDMKETGEDLESLAKVPFKIIEVNEEQG